MAVRAPHSRDSREIFIGRRQRVGQLRFEPTVIRRRSRVLRSGGDQSAVRAFVRSRHSVRGEAFLEAGLPSVEPAQIATALTACSSFSGLPGYSSGGPLASTARRRAGKARSGRICFALPAGWDLKAWVQSVLIDHIAAVVRNTGPR